MAAGPPVASDPADQEAATLRHRARNIADLGSVGPDRTEHLREVPLHSRLAYPGDLLKVHRDVVRCPDGHVTYREFVRHPGAVMIIALLDPEHVILERQFRYPLDRAFIEFPAGKRDAGEDPLACASRELLEETGYRARRWSHLGGFHNAIGYSDERIEVYLAGDLVLETARLDPGEVVEVFQAPWRQLDDWVRQGRITDVKTIVGVHWLERVMGGAWCMEPLEPPQADR
jgi:ADP-ribose pyrophosphatase